MYRIFKITANQTVDFAADELKKYLRMLMPECGDIDVGFDPNAQTDFRVGFMSDFGLDTSDAEDISQDDIVYIDADEKGGVIAGSNPCATLIAVYRYLRFQGCRWLFPGIDGERIPMIQKLEPVQYRKMADYRLRGQCNEGAEYQPNMIESIDFSPKIGLNSYSIEFDNPYVYYERYYSHTYNTVREPEPVHRDTILQWKRQCEVELQKRGMQVFDMGHGWTAEPFGLDSSTGWVPIEGYEETISDETRKYLALIKGERKLFLDMPICTNVCMSQPEVRRIMVNYIADYAQNHSNIGVLMVSFADARNNHCECDACRKKRPSDWYIILLNELDEELTKRNLDTKLKFSAYSNTFWAPLTEKLNNKNRFIMCFAPIWRLYTETYGEEPDMEKIAPFVHNNLILPHGMSESLAYLYQWKEIWDGDCFSFEYHFMDHQFEDPSSMFMAKLLYDDIQGLKKHNLTGLLEDGSQRSFFPTGFNFYLYGEALFDASVPYETLKEDYFSHAFGQDWQEVVRYLEAVRDCLDFTYFNRYVGQQPKYAGKSFFYDPAMQPKAAKVHEIVREFAPIIAKNKRQYYRASTVAWQILDIYNHALDKIASVVENKCVGNDREAIAFLDEMYQYLSEKEIYIERYFDFFMFVRQWEALTDGLREQLEVNNLTV